MHIFFSIFPSVPYEETRINAEACREAAYITQTPHPVHITEREGYILTKLLIIELIIVLT